MAKAEKTKLPKELGGFKLAKALRKAQPIEELMSTPEGRAVLSETVLAGMNAALAVLRRAEPETDAADPEPRDSRIAATRLLADGIDGAMAAWTEQFGPASAEAAPARKTTRRRAPAAVASPEEPAAQAPAPRGRRKPRASAAETAEPGDATLI